MALENGKWRVVRGDCLWNIAKSVYGNPYRWTDIANANGISQRNPVIYPGQLFTLPGVTPGTSGGGGSAPAPTPATTLPNIVWFALTAGSEREMQAVWTYNATHFWTRWEQWDSNGHLWMVSENKNAEFSDEQKASLGSLKDTEGWNVCRFSVRPVDKDGNPLANTTWAYKEYDFRNNPPSLPPTPSIDIDISNILTVTIENISEDINADSIEIAIYQNDTIKYSTAKTTIDKDARFAKYTCTVDPGGEYKVRCRAVRGTVYGGWTEFTNNEQALPDSPSEITTLRPQVISEQMSKKYGVFVEWPEVKTAKTYQVEWTTNIEYFDSTSGVSSVTTEEGKGPRILISDIEVGHEYFFRVRSINDKGSSQTWSAINSVKIGSKPSAPTTWSNTTSSVIGENLNLYWVHNATDNSIETYARLNIIVIDAMHPDREPMEYTKVIQNTKPEEDKNKTSVYTINSTDDEWSLLQSGFIIKWKVQTAGVASEYSDWSIEREVNVYAKPELELDITNQNGESISEINSFPFHISVLAKPPAQTPISYYLEIIANQGYQTVDEVGNVNIVNPGDKVYQRYYDPSTNPWRFIAIMSPSNIDLENEISYTVNCTVSMNSGLNATSSKEFIVYFNDLFYDVFADIVVNKETLEASIHPYCYEYYEEDGQTLPKLTENCSLSVYRREYDGSFTEIATDVNNEENLFVTDPHPSLDYARYRVVARTNDTGAISYSDIRAVKIGEPSTVIQWAEKWSSFETGDDYEGTEEPAWAGSMLKIPYNVTISESNNLDVSLVEYAGRKHPVSYYGTQLGTTSSWSVEIPKDDKETLYAIRRLAAWSKDVYVRAPSGIGYWANVTVSYNISYSKVTIPITFNIKRVEGGM